jgi:hypothetical protein
MYKKTDDIEKISAAVCFIEHVEHLINPQNKILINPVKLNPDNYSAKQLRHPSRAWRDSYLYLYDFFNTQRPDYLLSCDYDWFSNIPEGVKFDLIIGDKFEEFGFKESPQSKDIFDEDFPQLLELLNLLTDKGVAVIFLGQKLINDTIKDLGDSNFHAQAVVGIPNQKVYENDYLSGMGQLSTSGFVVIGKKQVDSIFLTDLEPLKGAEPSIQRLAELVLSGLISEKDEPEIGYSEFGQVIKKEEFKFEGFQAFRGQFEYEKLQSIYKDYQKFRIEDIALEINNLDKNWETYEEKDNAIYIPKHLKYFPITTSTEEVVQQTQEGSEKLTQVYYQIILNEKIKNDYVLYYFQSKLGEISLQANQIDSVGLFWLEDEDYTNGILMEKLLNLTIPVPDMDTQDLIIKNHQKIKKLQANLDLLKTGIQFNPVDLESASIFDTASSAIYQLTAVNQLKELIDGGESRTVEFKETFSFNTHTKNKDTEIEKSSLKNISGFLNSTGGKLIIGVSDSQKISGIENEVNKLHSGSFDKFLLHFKNNIEAHIGLEFSDYMDYDIMPIDDVNLLLVTCLESPKPCFLFKKDLYVRTNPSCDKLEGEKALNYIQNHWRPITDSVDI